MITDFGGERRDGDATVESSNLPHKVFKSQETGMKFENFMLESLFGIITKIKLEL